MNLEQLKILLPKGFTLEESWGFIQIKRKGTLGARFPKEQFVNVKTEEDMLNVLKTRNL